MPCDWDSQGSVAGYCTYAPQGFLCASCGKELVNCMDATASNYNPDASEDDGSCSYGGCTDPGASNYDPTATEEDWSCVYDFHDGDHFGGGGLPEECSGCRDCTEDAPCDVCVNPDGHGGDGDCKTGGGHDTEAECLSRGNEPNNVWCGDIGAPIDMFGRRRMQETLCEDTAGWADSSLYGCSIYASQLWCGDGAVTDNRYAGNGAEENCCACGGGDSGSNLPAECINCRDCGADEPCTACVDPDGHGGEGHCHTGPADDTEAECSARDRVWCGEGAADSGGNSGGGTGNLPAECSVCRDCSEDAPCDVCVNPDGHGGDGDCKTGGGHDTEEECTTKSNEPNNVWCGEGAADSGGNSGGNGDVSCQELAQIVGLP